MSEEESNKTTRYTFLDEVKETADKGLVAYFSCSSLPTVQGMAGPREQRMPLTKDEIMSIVNDAGKFGAENRRIHAANCDEFLRAIDMMDIVEDANYRANALKVVVDNNPNS